MAFSSSMKTVLSHVQACMWSCSLALLLLPGFWPPHPSAVACMLQYTKTKSSVDTWAIDPWVRMVPSFLCASLFQTVCVRVGDVFLVATWNLFVSLYSEPSPADLACLRNHLLHACRYWYCGCHPQDTAVGRDRTHYSFPSIRAVAYGLQQLLFFKKSSAVRSRISSKLFFASCVGYFDLACSKTRMRSGLLNYF